MRRASGNRGPASLHQSGLQWGVTRWQPLYAAGTEKPLGAHPRLPVLRTGARPRRERGAEYSSGRAGPSGANAAGCRRRSLRSPRLEAWGACHPNYRDTARQRNVPCPDGGHRNVRAEELDAAFAELISRPVPKTWRADIAALCAELAADADWDALEARRAQLVSERDWLKLQHR
jgi:hypothetical protein